MRSCGYESESNVTVIGKRCKDGRDALLTSEGQCHDGEWKKKWKP